MYIRLALKEREKHWKLFLFIILQLTVTFIVAICCVSVLDNQYRRYSAYRPITGKEGWFVYTNLGLRMPETDAGTGKTGREVLQKYLQSTKIICSYSIFAEIMRDKNVLDMECIVYDKELIKIMDPAIKEGRWLKVNDSDEIEAVISQNYYGLKAGDIIDMVPYSTGEPDQTVPVRIVGELEENADIIKMNYSPDMVDYHNFSFNLKERFDIPLLIMQQEDFGRLSKEWPQLREVLWPTGLLFIQYDENITDGQLESNDKFIENNIQIAIKEPLATVREKSIQYVKGQLGETLPVFLVFLIMTVMSTICVSVLEVKQHIRNLYIYRIVGIDKAGCFRIQLLVNIIILCETILITALACAVLKKFGTDIIFLEFGLWQLIICISIIIFWLGIVYMVQKIMLGDHELWRIKR